MTDRLASVEIPNPERTATEEPIVTLAITEETYELLREAEQHLVAAQAHQRAVLRTIFATARIHAVGRIDGVERQDGQLLLRYTVPSTNGKRQT